MQPYIIEANNANQALELGLSYLRYHGIETASRNGPVLRAPGPVITATQKPLERVLFSGLRDANPFFHLTEALWMLAGRNDVRDISWIVPRMAEFSDDAGVTLNGAYGYRWRQYFGYDQLAEVVRQLGADHTSRRAVLSMWNPAEYIEGSAGGPNSDLLNQGSKDLPCNTHIYFDAGREVLDMTVCCRSNDAVWGCHGANAVHFSVLQEVLAWEIGIPVGVMYQFSNNYHIYSTRPDVKRLYDHTAHKLNYMAADLYARHVAQVHPLLSGGEDMELLTQDCAQLFELGVHGDKFRTAFMKFVYVPMMEAYIAYTEGDDSLASTRLAGSNNDWHMDARRWLSRRIAKRVQERS